MLTILRNNYANGSARERLRPGDTSKLDSERRAGSCRVSALSFRYATRNCQSWARGPSIASDLLHRDVSQAKAFQI